MEFERRYTLGRVNVKLRPSFVGVVGRRGEDASVEGKRGEERDRDGDEAEDDEEICFLESKELPKIDFFDVLCPSASFSDWSCGESK